MKVFMKSRLPRLVVWQKNLNDTSNIETKNTKLMYELALLIAVLFLTEYSIGRCRFENLNNSSELLWN